MLFIDDNIMYTYMKVKLHVLVHQKLLKCSIFKRLLGSVFAESDVVRATVNWELLWRQNIPLRTVAMSQSI